MLYKSLCALALAATSALATSETSPYFLLASTAELPVSPDNVKSNPPLSEVHDALWPSLGSCPTKHYAVIVEPNTLSFPYSTLAHTSFVPQTQNARSTFSAKDVDGKVWIVGLLNTILMDCLDYGILRVEQLDTSSDAIAKGVPTLDQEILDRSIIYADMPAVDAQLSLKQYETLMESRKQFVEDLMETYFGNEHYTLIYIREQEIQAEGTGMDLEEEAEMPLVGDY